MSDNKSGGFWHRVRSAWLCLRGKGESYVSLTFLGPGQTRGYSRRFFLRSDSSCQNYVFRLGGRLGVELEKVDPPFTPATKEQFHVNDPIRDVESLQSSVRMLQDDVISLNRELGAHGQHLHGRIDRIEARLVKPKKKKATKKKATKKKR